MNRKKTNFKSSSLVKSNLKDAKQPSNETLTKLLLFYQNGQFDKAEKLAVLLTDKYPNNQFAWKVLGALFRQSGRISESLVPMQMSAKLAAHDAEAHNNLGVTQQDLRQLGHAEKSFRLSISLNPKYAEAHYNLGLLLMKSGKLDEARASFEQSIKCKPDYGRAHSDLGVTLHQLGNHEGAEKHYKESIKYEPQCAQTHNNLGVTLQELGRFDEAVASHEHSIFLEPRHAEAHCNLGVALQELGKLQLALKSYHTATLLRKNYADAHYNMGVTYQELGDLTAAEYHFLQALDFDPYQTQAHRTLSTIKSYTLEDTQFITMRNLYSDESISEEQRCDINFGLANAYEKVGDFKNAFEHFYRANLIRKKQLNYDIEQDIKLFDSIQKNHQIIGENSLDLSKLEASIRPIFIVGMPRSGTTLAEQIISSHSQVTGGGELGLISYLGRRIAIGSSVADSSSISDLRENYFKRLSLLPEANLTITDKTPQNFRFLGLIAAAFPEARIIHLRRDPAAVCWSNYRQYFASKGLGYCYSLNDVIDYFKLYDALMDFWRRELQIEIYELDYEQLVENQETETRKLIGHLKLSWDPKCLSPESSHRAIKTATNIQIRRKVYRGSSLHWRRYLPYLNGAFDDL